MQEESSNHDKQPSAMMRQYWDIKSQHPDALLFFRLGDFYELFDTDAQVAHRELEITLTGRPEPSYPGGRVPMAGVPFRSVDMYLSRLLSKGYSVAICEQVGVVGSGKGPVERRVSRILTPGTVLESHLLPSRENNYLVSLCRGSSFWGMAVVDASCGEFRVTQLTEDQLVLELGRLSPREVLAAKRTVRPEPGDIMPREVLDIPAELKEHYRITGRPAMFFQYEPAQRRLLQSFGVTTLDGFGCQSMPLAVAAGGAALEYLERTQGAEMPRFSGITTYSVDGHLVLDPNTRRNLELTETVRERTFEGSLLWVLDRTKTGMGSRTLRRWIMEPLYSAEIIRQRQEAIGELMQDGQRRELIEKALTGLSDLERLAIKLSSGSISPKDCLAVQQSLSQLPDLSKAVSSSRSELLSIMSDLPDELAVLHNLIADALKEDCPRELTEGNIFREGYSAELDEIRQLLTGGKKWLDDFQKRESELTGIRSLKVGFNQNFGYFIEVTHANKDMVPERYIRKQTLTNAERYITPDLKEYEARILNAEKNQTSLEYKMFADFRQKMVDFGAPLKVIARHISELDAILSLTAVAIDNHYVCPVVDESLVIEIRNGRHPVLEKIVPRGRYVANDTTLNGDSDDHQVMILTGPNMSGKSSLLRQVAHIVLMAQMGSFVPADSAHIGLVDRIFTRIGAVDDLSQGQSTFLVEMAETTQCCLAATARSLILLDEVGRGTSTYDGVAIAWSVAEYLADQVRARTIFATHYHELNGLSNFFPGIVNYQVLVKEENGRVEFIRKIVPGGASRSFGIQVARMAGLPSQVIERAQMLMTQMEKRSGASKILDEPKLKAIMLDEAMQLSLFQRPR